MREILFRGKRCDNLEWVEGYLLKECNYSTCSWNLGIEYKTDRFGKFAYDVAEIIPESISEFTGLTDKNGKKIFEDDIGKSIDGVFLVRWSEEKCAFVMDFYNYPKEELYLEEMWDDAEIIGNIHDNPELLRGEEDG